MKLLSTANSFSAGSHTRPPRIGFSLQSQYDLPFVEIIPLLKQAGFSAISPLWSAQTDFETMANCAANHGMTLQSLHAPHKDISYLWQPDSEQAAAVQKNLMGCLDTCARYQVPIMVLHAWQGLVYTFPDTPLDFRIFDQAVDYALKKGVTIAFENLEGEEYLAALMARYPQAGFCWDSGHDHCYPHKTDFLDAYGDRLIMTHLNDNWGLRDPAGIPSGNDDLHFLPYDGNLDWNHAISKLKRAKQQSILNFEIKVRSHSTAPEDLPYVQLSIAQFLEKAGAQARKIAQLLG